MKTAKKLSKAVEVEPSDSDSSVYSDLENEEESDSESVESADEVCI